MEDKELEKTKPIKILSDLSDKRVDKYENEDSLSRSEKYKDTLLKEEKREQEELAEEALAEKNIALAEELLKEENNENYELGTNIDENYLTQEIPVVSDDTKDEKKSLVEKIKDKWDGFDKKKKILSVIIMILVLTLIIIFLIFLILKLTEKPEEVKKNEPTKEVVPVVVDNFYYSEGRLYFLDDTRKKLGSYECKNQDDKLCYVGLNIYQDDFDVVKLLNSEGEVETQRLPIYEEDYVFVYDNTSEDGKEIILYSMKENKEIAKYLDVKAYDGNYVVVQNEENLYGLIKIENGVTEVIKPEYLSLGMIDGQDNLIAKTKKGYVIVDKKNKVLSSEFDASYKIKNYNKYFVVALVAGDYNVYDYQATMLDGGYDFVTIADKYMALVKGKKLYVKDNEKVKYTETGIKLNNNDYVKTYVYNENDQLVETRRSFDINIKNDTLEIGVYKTGVEDATYTQLSIIEALANKKYDYVNYFDGKLYFYGDVEKNTLLGTYTCTNSNSVTKDTDLYTNCFVATDTVFEDNDMVMESYLTRLSSTPIINNKYVLISDGNNNIVLFDLENKKTMSSYSKVNTFMAHNDNKVTLHNGKIEAVVLNKKGKYGMITIDGDNVNTTYNFEYGSLEKLGNYMLGLDSSNNWRVLYENSESVGFTEKVRGYSSNIKYFKTMSNGKYYVYDANGDKVSKDSYSYVELYTTYYAGINNNKLDIYDYEGNKLSSKSVTIGNYKYYGVDNPAFKVKKDGDNYVVSVYDGTQYNNTTVTLVNIEEEVVPDVDNKKEEDNDSEENKKEESTDENKEQQS